MSEENEGGACLIMLRNDQEGDGPRGRTLRFSRLVSHNPSAALVLPVPSLYEPIAFPCRHREAKPWRSPAKEAQCIGKMSRVGFLFGQLRNAAKKIPHRILWMRFHGGTFKQKDERRKTKDERQGDEETKDGKTVLYRCEANRLLSPVLSLPS